MSDNQGYEYDSAGNVTKDAANKRFVYDAENKQVSEQTAQAQTAEHILTTETANASRK